MRKAGLTIAAICAAGVLCAPAVPARADMTSQEVDRFTVIVGGWELEQRCEHLDDRSHGDLGSAVARAKTQAARELGAERTQQILASARAFGREQSADCGSETREQVLLSLTLAQGYVPETVQASGPADAAPQDDPEEPLVTAPVEQVPAEEAVAPESQQAALPAETEVDGALERFGEQTRAYYLQRRCGHLSYRQDYRFWQLIAQRHNEMLRRYGGRAIRRLQREAESSANSASFRCDLQTRRIIDSAYATIRRDAARN